MPQDVVKVERKMECGKGLNHLQPHPKKLRADGSSAQLLSGESKCIKFSLITNAKHHNKCRVFQNDAFLQQKKRESGQRIGLEFLSLQLFRLPRFAKPQFHPGSFQSLPDVAPPNLRILGMRA